jgi:hypothetical protein
MLTQNWVLCVSELNSIHFNTVFLKWVFGLEFREYDIIPTLRANYFNTFELGTIVDICHIWYILR